MKVKQVILTPNKNIESIEVLKDSLVVCATSYDHLSDENEILKHIYELVGYDKYSVKVAWEK